VKPPGNQAAAGANPTEKGPEAAAPRPEGINEGPPKRLVGHLGAVTALAGSQDGHRLLSGGADESVRLWDVDAGRVSEFRGAGGEARSVALSVALSLDGRYAAAAGTQGMWCWDTSTGQAIEGVNEKKPMGGVFFSSDGKRLFVAGADGTIHSFRMDTKRLVWAMSAPYLGMIRCLAGVPGDRLCLYVAKDETIHLYDLATRQDVKKLQGASAPITAAACAPDGHEVAGVAATDVQFWELPAGNKADRLLRHNAPVTSLAYSPDGRHILTGCQDGSARLWDAKTGVATKGFGGHKGAVRSVAFSGDGRFAITGGEDGVILIWPVPK
jgi:WD40 repeat protein